MAPTPRERERWYAVWLQAQGWTTPAAARALEGDAHAVGQWVRAFAGGGPEELAKDDWTWLNSGAGACGYEVNARVKRSSTRCRIEGPSSECGHHRAIM